MSRVFEGFIEGLCERSGYDYDFLVNCYMDILDICGYVNHESFEAIVMNSKM